MVPRLARPALALALSLATAASGAGAQSRPARDPFAGLDQVVLEAMKTWKVPGLAIAVTTRDSTILARGYGVLRLGEATPVDAHTLFAIGSASKAFTGASLAMLADDGKLAMDDRVVDRLPYFQMYDPWVTREIRLRDLLLHRSGLERGDASWYGTTRSREAVVRTLRDLPPTTSFRTRFQYQNLMYITAGEVIHEVSGVSWDDFVQARIFRPLGMTASNTSVRALAGLANVAQPHAELGGAVRPIPYRTLDNAGAAGSINSNVLDMARWVRLWLNGGQAGGHQVLSEAMTREAMRPQVTMDDAYLTALIGNPLFPGYGFGWFVASYRGKRHVGHGGNIDGMAAMVGFLPDDGIGVVVLTNMNQSSVTVPLVNHLFDRALGLGPTDTFTPYRAAEAAFMKSLAAPPPVVATGTRPSMALDAYAGTYRHPMLGTATVRVVNGALEVNYDASRDGAGTLAHQQYDTFLATMRDPMLGVIPVTFQVGARGAVEGMVFPIMGVDRAWVREGGR